MQAIFSFIAYILKRSTRHWQVLLTLSLGVLFATALLASGPLLVDTVIQFGLRSALISADPINGNIFITSSSANYSLEEFDDYAQQMENSLSVYMGEYIRGVHPSIQSRWVFPWQEDILLSEDRFNFVFLEGIDERVEFIQGGWAEEIYPESGVIKGVIGESMAGQYAIEVGDLLPISVQDDDETPEFWLEVSGVVQVKDFSDPYWFGEKNLLLNQQSNRWLVEYAVLVPKDYIFEVSDFLFDRSVFALKWRVMMEHSKLRAEKINNLYGTIEQLPEELAGFPIRVVAETKINEVLVQFAEQAEIVRAPLYLLTVEIVLLALYYVVMVAGLAVKQVEKEFAILSSRGASRRQIFQIQVVEAGIISLGAILSGPVMGVGLIRALTDLGPLRDVVHSGWGLDLTAGSWMAAAIGGGACILSLLMPVGPVMKRSIVTQTMSLTRRNVQPLWQRLYLDVFLLAAGLVFFVRTRIYGGIVVEDVSATATVSGVDWLLLLSPIALMLGAATIMLRVFPLILKLLEKGSVQGRGLSIVLAMWQAARNPNQVAQLVLLLTLSMALGVFSSGLNATLDRSEFERSQYSAGTDYRLRKLGDHESVEQIVSAPAVTGYAEVFRSSGGVQVRGIPKYELLAIEPNSLASISHFRDDYSTMPMGQLLGFLADNEDVPNFPTYTLPGMPDSVGVWVWARLDPEGEGVIYDGISDLDRIGFQIKLMDANGDYYLFRMKPEIASNEVGPGTGNYPEDGWQYFSAQIPDLPDDAYPLSVHSIWIQNRVRATRFLTYYNALIAIDDLTITDRRFEDRIIVSSFENVTEIWAFDDPDGNSVNAIMDRAHSGEHLIDMRLYFDQPLEHLRFGLPINFRFSPIPVLVSPEFLEVSGAEIGNRIRVSVSGVSVYVEIKGVVDYFPTMYESEKAGFMIAPRDWLILQLNRHMDVVEVNEYWMRTEGVSLEGIEELVEGTPNLSLVSTENVRVLMKSDPMALGLRGVITFGFLITTILSLVGFGTYFYINAKQRGTYYGILRSIGLSPGQLYASLIFEQVVMIAAGLGLGTGLGVLINKITLSGLPINLGNQGSVPPFIPHSDWAAIGDLYGILGAAFLITLGAATIFLYRANIHQALRIGEE